MLMVKSENEEVVTRQLAFFATTCGVEQFTRLTPTAYQYNFIPGTESTNVDDIIEYLQHNVWNLQSLPHDGGEYQTYIKGIFVGASSTVLELLEAGSGCLVHGDATLENFILTRDHIQPIDPGLPRGFCCQSNDVGKLLQSWLTHWKTVRHGARPSEFSPMNTPVRTMDIASLITHWYRIIKNADRHPEYVRWYALNQAIPILTDAISGPAGSSSGYRWSTGELKKLYCALLPTGP